MQLVTLTFFVTLKIRLVTLRPPCYCTLVIKVTRRSTMDKQCEFCGKVFLAKRNTARYCSDLCKVSASRGKAPKEVEVELKELPQKIGLPPLHEVDRTRAFTPEEMELVRKLPTELWLAYMERPNAATTMTYEERVKHYVSSNYPHGAAKYEKAGEQSSRWGAH